jgi:hypothetical protein
MDQVLLADEGPQGPPGVNWRDDVASGDYSPSASYSRGDGVYLGGSSYRCIQDCSGVSPPDAAHWKPVALGGLDAGVALPQLLRIMSLRA